MCIGIDHCSKKNCLEQEQCVFPEKLSLKMKINGPDVLGSIDLSGMRNCPFHVKSCSNERACEILGQCLITHPLIKKDKTAKKQLRGKATFNQIVKIAERLMPSLNKPRLKNKKTNR